MPAAEVAMAAGVGGAAGGVSAVTIVFAIARRRLRFVKSVTAEDDEFNGHDEFPEEQAREAARQWSERAGEPDAESLITEKLRVGWEVQQRRARRARR